MTLFTSANPCGRSLRRIALLAVAAMLGVLYMQAEIPTGYYRSLNGKKTAELKTAVYNIIHNFTRVSSYQALPSYFQQTDVYPESRRWWDMYSDIPLYAPSFAGLNREHSFPKSWWKYNGSVEYTSAYVDLNHLYPSEARANQAKSNYPLGVVDTRQNVKFDNGITKVGYPVTGQGGGANYVFEPDDEYKGDFARTYFYMVTCYQDLHWATLYMLTQGTYPTLNGWSVDLLLKWHRQDPVSEKETLRNEAVYKIQNNRNPFIDYPSLAEYIWGNRMGEAFTETGAGTEPAGDPTLITPVQDMALDFGEVAEGQTATARLWFNGENLTGSLSLTLSPRDQFSIPTRSIASNLVNAADGYWLTVTYKPTAQGEHTARLAVYDGGLAGSLYVNLRGTCLPVPNLTACTATAPTDITADSYVANWTVPADETVDYWVVTRTRYAGGTATTEELVAEAPSLQIDGFAGADYETYSVQSVRLGYRSPMSNVITVSPSGVTDVTADDMPLAVSAFEGVLRFDVTAEHTNGRIYDTQGRLFMRIDVVAPGMMVDVPAGIYLIVTDQAKRPLKAIVR